MDYEVFLLTRVREEYDRTGDNAQAVADGLAATGRVITAAAAMTISRVFGAFVLGEGPRPQAAGFGLALAIFIDATVVRLVLVPSLMELMGDWNWYLPKWLRWLPVVRVRGCEVRPEGNAGPAHAEPEPGRGRRLRNDVGAAWFRRSRRLRAAPHSESEDEDVQDGGCVPEGCAGGAARAPGEAAR